MHFPIALLLVGTLFSLLALRRQQDAFEQSGYHCLVAGWFGAVAATATGLWDAWQHIYSSPLRNDATILNYVNLHAVAGIATLIIYGQAVLKRRRHTRVLFDATTQRGYLTLLLLGAAVIIVGGWLGGQLVYRFGIGVAI